MDYCIELYNHKKDFNNLLIFLEKVFSENNRKLDINKKDDDILDINNIYLTNGIFLLAKFNNEIIGTISLRYISNLFELRRFFVLKNYQNQGLGNQLLRCIIRYAIDNDISAIFAATLNNSKSVEHIFSSYGFLRCEKYKESSADLFWRLSLDYQNYYTSLLKDINSLFKNTLILNPTENFPYRWHKNYDVSNFEGIYVSKTRKKGIDEDIIFGGREPYINLFEKINNHWKTMLNAYDVDLKTLSGLNMHLITFLSIAKNGEKILLLPEICGGHFATEEILRRLGFNILLMIPDFNNFAVNIEETKKIIETQNPKFIFVDRSEGLYYEDFSWLNVYSGCIKIFDCSQYLSQILTKCYTSPFDMGFDIIMSTLHKNYPGPQKGIIATKYCNDIWKSYIENSKLYISNTHPENIVKSIIPLINYKNFYEYSNQTFKLITEFEKKLIALGIPVIKKDENKVSSLHIWIKCNTKNETHSFFKKLELYGLLVNYRKLPYNLGHGLRLGLSGAISQGIKKDDLDLLAKIIYDIFMSDSFDKSISDRVQKFIIKATVK